jgi:hypothetical protein
MSAHVAVVMICPQSLAEKICQGYYEVVSKPGGDVFCKKPGPGRSIGESVGMAVLPLKHADSPHNFVEYAKTQAQQARSLNQFGSLMEETAEHVRLVQEHWEQNKKAEWERRGRPAPSWDWGVGMNPTMEKRFLPVFQPALYASRVINGEEQALISVIEYPTPPTYINLDCEGLVAHGTMPKSAQSQNVLEAISCARREIFEEAGLYVPQEFFNASSAPSGLPSGLGFTHGPYILPTKRRYLHGVYICAWLYTCSFPIFHSDPAFFMEIELAFRTCIPAHTTYVYT